MKSYRKQLCKVTAAKGVSVTESLGVLSFSQEFMESFESVSFHMTLSYHEIMLR